MDGVPPARAWRPAFVARLARTCQLSDCFGAQEKPAFSPQETSPASISTTASARLQVDDFLDTGPPILNGRFGEKWPAL
jgi:hypothetical protein